jgi:ABC-2 type transport system ATP-binding protein/nitrous oxidase accessory protein
VKAAQRQGEGETTVIEVRDLSKRYGRTAVLEGISFTMDEGEVAVLLGANGAGKTTLLKCLLGLVHFQGEARIGGLDVTFWGKEVRRLVGYLPQTPAFPPHLTVADALVYYADLRGLRGEDIDARLAQVGLTAHADKRVGALSGGLRQRLGLAVALLGDPPVLLMDEPVANLDPEGRQLFAGLVARWRAAGRTVLLSTHVVRMLDGLAERALVLSGGRLVYDGRLDALLRSGVPLPATPEPEQDGDTLEAVLRAAQGGVMVLTRHGRNGVATPEPEEEVRA